MRGGTESDRVAVRDAVARAAAGSSLLALSPARVAGAIEQVPTIRLASVDRDFPHTLRIHIVPERAVALTVGPGHYRSLVAASGRVLHVFGRHDATPALPKLWTTVDQRPVEGGSLHAPQALAALDALAARPPGFGAQIANVKVEPERGIVMRLSGGLDIVLGPPLALRAQIACSSVGSASLSVAHGSRAAHLRRRLGARPAGGHAARRVRADGGTRRAAAERPQTAQAGA